MHLQMQTKNLAKYSKTTKMLIIHSFIRSFRSFIHLLWTVSGLRIRQFTYKTAYQTPNKPIAILMSTMSIWPCHGVLAKRARILFTVIYLGLSFQ